MAKSKYGRLSSESHEFPTEEPYFLIRGKDILGPMAVEMYANLLRAAAAGAVETHWIEEDLLKMAQDVSDVAAEMLAWQAANPDSTKLPD